MSEWKNNRLQISSRKTMNSLFMGNFKAAFAGKGIEFQDFREYTPEDDAKYIDWLTSSREGTTVMRRYREEKEWNILVIADSTESLDFQWWLKKKLQLEVIELLSWASLGSGEAFGWYVIWRDEWKYIPPKKNLTSLYKFKRYTSILPRWYKSKFDISELSKRKWKKSIIFIVSDSLDIDEKSFRIVALQHDLIYVHLSTHFENTLSWSWLQILKGKSLKLWVDLDDVKAKEIYINKRTEQLQEFSRKVQKIWADSIFIDELSSLYAEFLKLMKRREK